MRYEEGGQMNTNNPGGFLSSLFPGGFPTGYYATPTGVPPPPNRSVPSTLDTSTVASSSLP
jgi:hypothetical protein